MRGPPGNGQWQVTVQRGRLFGNISHAYYDAGALQSHESQQLSYFEEGDVRMYFVSISFLSRNLYNLSSQRKRSRPTKSSTIRAADALSLW